MAYALYRSGSRLEWPSSWLWWLWTSTTQPPTPGLDTWNIVARGRFIVFTGWHQCGPLCAVLLWPLSWLWWLWTSTTQALTPWLDTWYIVVPDHFIIFTRWHQCELSSFALCCGGCGPQPDSRRPPDLIPDISWLWSFYHIHQVAAVQTFIVRTVLLWPSSWLWISTTKAPTRWLGTWNIRTLTPSNSLLPHHLMFSTYSLLIPKLYNCYNSVIICALDWTLQLSYKQCNSKSTKRLIWTDKLANIWHMYTVDLQDF